MVFSSSKFSLWWAYGAEHDYRSERASSLLAALNKRCVLLCVRGKWSQVWIYSSDVACSSVSCSDLPRSHLPAHLHNLRQLKLRSVRQQHAMVMMNWGSCGSAGRYFTDNRELFIKIMISIFFFFLHNRIEKCWNLFIKLPSLLQTKYILPLRLLNVPWSNMM